MQNRKAENMFKGRSLWKCWGVVIFLVMSATPVFGRETNAQTENSSWWSWLGFSDRKKADASKANVTKVEAKTNEEVSQSPAEKTDGPSCSRKAQEKSQPEPQPEPVTSATPGISDYDDDIVPPVQAQASHGFGSLNAQTPNNSSVTVSKPQYKTKKASKKSSVKEVQTQQYEIKQAPRTVSQRSCTIQRDVKQASCKRSKSRSCVPHCKEGSVHQHYTNRGYERTCGDVYLMPYWPFYSQFFQKGDLIQALFTFDTASQAYAGHGHSQDLSKLIFGQNAITIKEILLASKLLSTGLLTMTPVGGVAGFTAADNFLNILADQEITFDASLTQCVGAINYARSFRCGDVTVGFHIPVKMRQQKLRITNDITPARQKQLVAADAKLVAAGSCDQFTFSFSAQFDSLSEFVDEILARKGLGFNDKQTILGFSDITSYVNFEIHSCHVDHMLAGFTLLLPTASGRDTSKLWHTDLGNGGFVETSAFLSMLWQRNRWFNPHVHFRGTLGLTANVNRRVPFTNSYDGANTFNNVCNIIPNTTSGTGLIIFGETLKFPPATVPPTGFAVDDSTIRGFADKAVRVKIHPGPQFFCRLGNTIDAVFGYRGFLDLYYDFLLRGKDYLRQRSDGYKPDILNRNTASMTHTFGLNYSYQFDDQFRLRLGSSYVFTGRNTAKTFGVDLTLNAEF